MIIGLGVLCSVFAFFWTALLTTTNESELQFIGDARVRRRNPSAYTTLLRKCGGALIGTNIWKKQHLTSSFSDYVTTADEAFLWLCLDTYLPIYNRNDIGDINPTHGGILMVSNKDSGSESSLTPSSPTSDEEAVFNTRQTSPTANGNRCGWTKEGIMRYNRYFSEISQERRSDTTFDAFFLKQCQENATPAQSKTVSKNNERPMLAFNCLLE